MSVIPLLSSSLGLRDESANMALAQQIVAKEDVQAIKELVENLFGKKQDIASDCIKVLYEAGHERPDLLVGYHKEFISLLQHKNNRLSWGAMTALHCIAKCEPVTIYSHLNVIVAAADSGSVITRDHAVGILITLCRTKKYLEVCMALLLEQLRKCPTNQLPAYAENALPIVTGEYREVFSKTLTNRIHEIEKDSKRKRVEKVLAKLAKAK